ncbi:MAG: hypothetical protein LBC94_00020 [Desulfovibrio sp.]|nr:hypothetical protein [Desulfovibrio sp.]
MGFTEDFKTLVKTAARKQFNGDADLAGQAGVSQSAVSQLNNNKRKGLQLETVGKLLDAIGAKLVFPGDEPSATIRRTGANSPVDTISDEDGENLVSLPVYAEAGARPGLLELSDVKPLFSIKIPPEYFRRSDMAVVVDGHSMEPTIQNRSIVGAQRNFNFVAGELYIANIPEEGLVVKRVLVSADRETFIFRSDNADKEHYPDFRISREERGKIIMGRVVWIMYRY